MSDKTEISHDKLFRTAFEDHFKSLIELVHPEVAATLDLDHLKFVGEKLFADFRKAGHVRPDIVAETTTLEGNPQLVLVHVEIERGFRSTIDERVWRYSMHLSLKSNKPVLTVVVFLSGGTAGVTVREIVKTVGAFEVSRHRFLALGLSGSLAEDYVDRPQPLAAALAALMRSEVWDRVERKSRCLGAVCRAPDLDDDKRFVLVKIINTYIELNEDEEQRFAAEMQREGNKEVREMVVTWEEALAESRAEGKTEGEATLLKRQLVHRFRDLPEWAERRLQEASRKELEGLAVRVVDAERLEDVFVGSEAGRA